LNLLVFASVFFMIRKIENCDIPLLNPLGKQINKMFSSGDNLELPNSDSERMDKVLYWLFYFIINFVIEALYTFIANCILW